MRGEVGVLLAFILDEDGLASTSSRGMSLAGFSSGEKKVVLSPKFFTWSSNALLMLRAGSEGAVEVVVAAIFARWLELLLGRLLKLGALIRVDDGLLMLVFKLLLLLFLACLIKLLWLRFEQIDCTIYTSLPLMDSCITTLVSPLANLLTSFELISVFLVVLLRMCMTLF